MEPFYRDTAPLPRDSYAVLSCSKGVRMPRDWTSSRFLIVAKDTAIIEEWFEKTKALGLHRLGEKRFQYDEWFLFYYIHYTQVYHDLKSSAGWLEKLRPHRTKPETTDQRFKIIPEWFRDSLRDQYKKFVDRIEFFNIPEEDFEAVAIKNLGPEMREDGKKNGYHAFTITAPCDWLLDRWFYAVTLHFPGEIKRAVRRDNRFRCKQTIYYFLRMMEEWPGFEFYRGFVCFEQIHSDDPRVQHAKKLH